MLVKGRIGPSFDSYGCWLSELTNGGSIENPAESITSHSIILSSIFSDVYFTDNSRLFSLIL